VFCSVKGVLFHIWRSIRVEGVARSEILGVLEVDDVVVGGKMESADSA
jgi:hypothetical protein